VAVEGPASRRLSVGEMFDASFVAPRPGEYKLTVGTPGHPLRYTRRIISR